MATAVTVSLTSDCGIDDDVAESNSVCRVKGKEHKWEVSEEAKAAIEEYMDDFLYLKARAHSFKQ